MTMSSAFLLSANSRQSCASFFESIGGKVAWAEARVERGAFSRDTVHSLQSPRPRRTEPDDRSAARPSPARESPTTRASMATRRASKKLAQLCLEFADNK